MSLAASALFIDGWMIAVACFCSDAVPARLVGGKGRRVSEVRCDDGHLTHCVFRSSDTCAGALSGLKP